MKEDINMTKSDDSVMENEFMTMELDLEEPEFISKVPNMSITRFRIIMFCLFSIFFLAAVDGTMVVTLTAQISSDLNSQEHISWVATAYLLSCAAFQPVFGKLSDIFGRKTILLGCLFGFAFGCMLCGLAQNLSTLVTGRFIAGIGGGGINTLSTICLSDLVSTRDRGLYSGYAGIAWDIGSISGGVLAGLFESLWGWQSAFWIQIPVCVVIGVIIYFWLDIPLQHKRWENESTWSKIKGIDWIGSILLITSLLSLMIITGTSQKDLPVGGLLWSFLLIYTGAGFLSFFMWEDKFENPIIPIHMLHNKTVLFCCFNNLFMNMNLYAYLFYLPFFWESVQNKSPLECGYLLIPGTIIATLVSVAGGWWIKQTGKYRTPWIYFNILMCVGSLIMYSSDYKDNTLSTLLKPLLLRVATSTNFNFLLVATLSCGPSSDQALITSIHYAFKSTGSTMGISLSNALMQFSLKRGIDFSFNNLGRLSSWSEDMLADAKERALNNPRYAFKEEIPEEVFNAIVGSYSYACHAVFIFLILTAIICTIFTIFTKENQLELSHNQQE
ncbi:hypothetical protein DAMA08_031390 [Martiniozyma asiatica (nom. inval.)]|nr:hypothetical protein DAMA08_031390 [Martiniozyma asiatica]